MQFSRWNAGTNCLFGAVVGILLVVIGYAVYVSVTDNQSGSSASFPYQKSPINSDENPSNVGAVRSASDLDSLLESKSAFYRDLAVRRLLANSNKRRAKELFRIANGLSSTSTRDAVQSIIVEKLASIDPSDTIELVEDLEADQRRLLLEAIYQEWASTDLEAAVVHTESMNQTDRRSAFTGILAAESVLANQHALGIARSLDTEQVFLDHSASRKLLEPIGDPRSAFESFISLHGQTFEELSGPETLYMVSLVQSWIEEIGVDAVRLTFQQLTSDTSRIAMLNHLFTHSGDQELVLSVSHSTYEAYRDIVSRALVRWAESAPFAAFSVASSFVDTLTRRRLQRSTILTWSESDPQSLLDSINELPQNFRAWSHHLALLALAKDFPERAVGRLKEMPDGQQRFSAAVKIARNWGEKSPRAALDWAATNSFGFDLRRRVFEGISQVDPELAMELASEQPADNYEESFEAAIIAQVAERDAESALSMLHYAKDQKTLEAAYLSIGQALVEEGKAERAVDMVKNETKEFQSRFYRGIWLSWMRSDAQTMYDHLDKLPSSEVQALYALALLRLDQQEPFLEPEQIEKLESFKPE